MAFPPT
ncbi:MAG: hypothetical protein EZS28_048530, partial [Streblomastix strix]